MVREVEGREDLRGGGFMTVTRGWGVLRERVTQGLQYHCASAEISCESCSCRARALQDARRGAYLLNEVRSCTVWIRSALAPILHQLGEDSQSVLFGAIQLQWL